MKVITLPKDEALILMQALNSADGGMNVGQMRSALKLAALVEPLVSEGGTFEVEDHDHRWLSDRLNKQEWIIVSSTIVSLVDRVRDAPAKVAA